MFCITTLILDISRAFHTPVEENINVLVTDLLTYPGDTIMEFKQFISYKVIGFSCVDFRKRFIMLIEMLNRILQHKNALDIDEVFWIYVLGDMEETLNKTQKISLYDEIISKKCGVSEEVRMYLDQIRMMNAFSA